jgi:DNA-directed RNA polymerase specialized sigma24 family protein
VRTIAGNVVRRARGRTPRSGYLELPAGRHEPIDGHHGPEVQAALSESAEHLGGAYALLLQLYARAFAELSERDRQALALVEVDGLGYAEAAACLGVRPANMKMIVFRARRRLVQRVELWLGGRRALAA